MWINFIVIVWFFLRQFWCRVLQASIDRANATNKFKFASNFCIWYFIHFHILSDYLKRSVQQSSNIFPIILCMYVGCLDDAVASNFEFIHIIKWIKCKRDHSSNALNTENCTHKMREKEISYRISIFAWNLLKSNVLHENENMTFIIHNFMCPDFGPFRCLCRDDYDNMIYTSHTYFPCEFSLKIDNITVHSIR